MINHEHFYYEIREVKDLDMRVNIKNRIYDSQINKNENYNKVFHIS